MLWKNCKVLHKCYVQRWLFADRMWHLGLCYNFWRGYYYWQKEWMIILLSAKIEDKNHKTGEVYLSKSLNMEEEDFERSRWVGKGPALFLIRHLCGLLITTWDQEGQSVYKVTPFIMPFLHAVEPAQGEGAACTVSCGGHSHHTTNCICGASTYSICFSM